MELKQNIKYDDHAIEEFFLKIWLNRKIVLVITGIFLLLGIIYAFLIAKPMYKSYTSLYPTNIENEGPNQLQILASQFGITGLGSTNFLNIVDVIKSRRIKKKIIERKWQTRTNPPLKQFLYDFWDINEDNIYKKKEIAIKKLDKLINVKKNDESGLITISILTEEPQLSADIVNFIAKETINYIIHQQQKNAGKKRKFIEKRLKDTKRELTLSEEALKTFKEKNHNYSENPELELEFERLKRKIMIKQEVYLTLQKQHEIAMIEERKDIPEVNILDVGEKAIKKEKPKRLLILILSIIIGIILSVIIILNLNLFIFLKNIILNKEINKK